MLVATSVSGFYMGGADEQPWSSTTSARQQQTARSNMEAGLKQMH
jgi:hypothetical protein